MISLLCVSMIPHFGMISACRSVKAHRLNAESGVSETGSIEIHMGKQVCLHILHADVRNQNKKLMPGVDGCRLVPEAAAGAHALQLHCCMAVVQKA